MQRPGRAGEVHQGSTGRLEGTGCAVSQAAMSLLSEKIKGMSLDAIDRLNADYIVKLLGVDLGPTRLRCAVLSLEAVKRAISG